MNLTLSVDELTTAKARLAAQAMGKSLNQLARKYLEQLLSEDLQHSQIISGVRVINPCAE